MNPYGKQVIVVMNSFCMDSAPTLMRSDTNQTVGLE